jgi:8-oxo-dGTP diphosphatase
MKKVLIVTNTIVKKGGKILLGRRTQASKLFPYHWCIPGGKLDKNESVVESAVREVEEETGLKVRITRLLEVSWKVSEKDIYAVFFDFEAVALTSRLRPVEKLGKLGWFSKKEISKLRMTPRDREILERYGFRR